MITIRFCLSLIKSDWFVVVVLETLEGFWLEEILTSTLFSSGDGGGSAGKLLCNSSQLIPSWFYSRNPGLESQNTRVV